VTDEKFVVDKRRQQQKKKKRRVVSGAMLEEGDGERLRGIRGGRGDYDEKREYSDDDGRRKKRKICMWIRFQ
jgi:glucan 1,3-beta-glucosidase